MKKQLTLILVVLAVVALAVMPAAAQDAQPRTITVTGTGSAAGAPDIANIIIGVEVLNPDLTVGFNEANTQIDNIINAVVDAGVAREDIRTSNLNIYLDRFSGPFPVPMMEMEVDPASSGMAQVQEPQPTFQISNQVRITVRDVDNVANVINAAVAAGANNIFGLEFGIEDRSELESEARAAAVADARARADELADLTGVTVGSVVSIQAGGASFGPFAELANMSTGMGSGGAVVEPGTLSVMSTVTITYTLEG